MVHYTYSNLFYNLLELTLNWILFFLSFSFLNNPCMCVCWGEERGVVWFFLQGIESFGVTNRVPLICKPHKFTWVGNLYQSSLNIYKWWTTFECVFVYNEVYSEYIMRLSVSLVILMGGKIWADGKRAVICLKIPLHFCWTIVPIQY